VVRKEVKLNLLASTVWGSRGTPRACARRPAPPPGARGIKFALRAATAHARGERLDEREAGQNARVKLR